MKVEDVMRCDFSSWFHTFEDVSIRSIILPIPPEFLEYLHADTVVLPEGSHQGAYTTDAKPEEEDDGENQVDWTTDSTCKEAKMPDCKGFLQEVDSAIAQLGGKVFPKANWSAPQDARWISFNNSLQCCHASDLCLLFKSSDFIMHDLTQPFVQCEDEGVASKDVTVNHQLVLRQWQDINPSQEFRCFVRHGKLIAICQRSHTKYCKHIVEDKVQIQEDIEEFFADTVDGDFMEEDGNYVFDVWRKKKGQVVLIDFNPFGPVTDPLLFDWDQLASLDGSQGVVFGCVESEHGVRPSRLAGFGVPTDFVDLATGQDPFKLMDLIKLGQAQDDSSSEEEEEDIPCNASTDILAER